MFARLRTAAPFARALKPANSAALSAGHGRRCLLLALALAASLHIQPPVCAHTVSLRARMPSRTVLPGTADFFERSCCMLLKCK